VQITEVLIDEISIGNRHRKDMGDIDGLARSIADIGCLQPPVATKTDPAGSDGRPLKLMGGQRRVEAFRRLGRDRIPVVIVDSIDDAVDRLKAERDENICRKDFTISEKLSLGEALEALERKDAKQRQGARTDIRVGTSGEVPHKSKPQRAADNVASAVGMDRRTYEKAKAVKESGDEKLVAEMNRTGKVNGAFKKMKVRQQAAELKAEPMPLPEGPFRVIVADPPWRYDKRAGDVTHRSTCPYPDLSIDEIKAFQPAGGKSVGEIAHDDSVLWLWTTNSHLPEAFSVIEAWGFTYKTTLTWAKPQMGMGDWLRGQTEHCLMAVKGKPTVTLTNQTTVVEGKSPEHSAKPDEFYEMVESLCPGSKVEIFSRTNREGWTTYGDESGTI
jgi:N6-adenosine-specific RNA methylase IME4